MDIGCNSIEHNEDKTFGLSKRLLQHTERFYPENCSFRHFTTHQGVECDALFYVNCCSENPSI